MQSSEVPGCEKKQRQLQDPEGRLTARLLHSPIRVLLFVLILFASPVRAQKTLPPKPIDLNTATIEQLQQLPGVGPATAKAIVQFREKSGPFQRPEDLLAVHGISRARFEKIKPYLVVIPARKSSLITLQALISC
jgi:competence ComEA-like helix-hairpin-helix protein